jgi:hypothetical protein
LFERLADMLIRLDQAIHAGRGLVLKKIFNP